MKDPILLTYTVEELAYEYYDRLERARYTEKVKEEEADRIEVEKFDEALAWAEEEEALEEAERAAAETAQEEPYDPTKDPANIEWMEEQMKKDKELHGESFGEDINMDFGE